jgi:hypothetical protein
VHSGAKIAKKPFLRGGTYGEKLQLYKENENYPGPVHPLGELGSAPVGRWGRVANHWSASP